MWLLAALVIAFELILAMLVVTYWIVLAVCAALLVALVIVGRVVAMVVRHARWRLGMRKRARGRVIGMYPAPRRIVAAPRVPPAPPRRRRS